MNKIDLRRFDLNLLVVFEVLMNERSVSLAADRLGRTQSAVSHALNRLRYPTELTRRVVRIVRSHMIDTSRSEPLRARRLLARTAAPRL